MINSLYWKSADTSPRLTPDEVEKLFDICKQLSEAGCLNGKFKTACVPLYWHRVRTKEN